MVSSKDAVTLLAAAGAGVAALLLLRKARQKSEDKAEDIPPIKLPPGIVTAFFPLKALFDLGSDSLQYGSGRLILQGCDASTGIATVELLGQSNIFLRSPDLVEEVIKKNYQAGGGYGKSFKGSPFDPLVDSAFGRGLFFAEDQDPQWSLAHKILTKPFSHRGILNMVPLICDQADALVAALQKEAAAGKPIYIYDYMVKMALETIAVCSMGTKFNVFNAQEAMHPFVTAFHEVEDAMLDLITVPTQLWWLCFLTTRKMKTAVHVLNDVVDEIVQKRVRKETFSSNKFPDLLDLMLAGDKGKQLSDKNIRSQILTFLFAGHDSTAAAMSSLIVFLLANPRVEAKLVDEIKQVVGMDNELQAQHIPELKYLDWCLKETLRLLPPAGSFQRMAFQEDLRLAGKWKVEKDQPIIVDIFALHMDPETWGPDADKFVPERWEKEPPHPYSYMPFASGPRGCIGKEFSVIEQKIVAVKLLQNFSMRSLQDWKPRQGNVQVKAGEPCAYVKLGIDAEFSPRQFFVGACLPVELQIREHQQQKQDIARGASGGA
eukprot:TRINITY_DN1290_c0_g1_i1.p1 TRINITY_DN1290_c0_g1~~TRINITY_DN1290_c0_g1_i1.p1  ORF type:complete len:546 (-),score=125.09 TRINITY_DN1290_c0_g1_i1:378-2015(-)